MESTELMKGNYLQDREGRLCIVTEITDDLDFCKYGFKAPAILGAVTSLPHKRIRLTEQWLLKFGFKREPWGLIKGGLLFKDWKGECEELTLQIGNGHNTRVKYVHHLQNLYLALTGKKL